MDSFIKAIDKLGYSQAVEELRFSSITKDYFSKNKVALFYFIVIFENEGCTATFIADLVGTSKSATIIQIKNLEDNGFIYKKVDPNDKRVKRLFLTEKALKNNQVFTSFRNGICNNLLNNHTKEDIEIFSKVLSDYCDIIIEYDKKNFDLIK